MSMKSLRTDGPNQISPPRTRDRPSITQIATMPLVPRVGEPAVLNTSPPFLLGGQPNTNTLSQELVMPKSAPPDTSLMRRPPSNVTDLIRPPPNEAFWEEQGALGRMSVRLSGHNRVETVDDPFNAGAQLPKHMVR